MFTFDAFIIKKYFKLKFEQIGIVPAKNRYLVYK